MSYSSHLEAAIIFSLLGEVDDVLYGGSRRAWHHAGTTEGHPTHGDGNHIHVGDSHSFIMNDAASAHCSYCRFCQYLQLHRFQGCFNGGCGWGIPPQAGYHLHEARGSAISCTSLGDLGGNTGCNFAVCRYSYALWCQALLPPALWQWCLPFNPLRAGGIGSTAVTGWGGCDTCVQLG